MRHNRLVVTVLAIAAAMALGTGAALAQDDAAAAAEREVVQRAVEEQLSRQLRQEQAARARELALREAEFARARQGIEIEAQERELDRARRELEKARLNMETAARQITRLSTRDIAVRYENAARVFMDRSYIGANLEDADAGARVVAVTPGGPAAEAGVASGDVITVINGVNVIEEGVDPSDVVVRVLSQADPGSIATVTVQRGDDTRTFDVETREGRSVFARTGPIRVFPEGPRGQFVNLAGLFAMRWNDMELVTLTETLGSYFGTTEGLLVVRAPDNDDIGLVDGDVILEISARVPSSPEHALRILTSFAPGETLELEIMRERRRRTLEYEIPTTND